MKRILLAALAGGFIIFVWGAFAHMALPAGTMGMSTLPNEDAVLQALGSNVPHPGLYFFPGWDMSGENTPEEEEAWMEKHRNGPAGMLIYQPKGGEAMPPTMLITEFLSNVITAFIIALLAASLVGPYLRRALLLSLFGVFAWCAISLSFWNWYHFPMAFIAGEGIDVVFGTALAALAVAKIVAAPAAKQ